MKPIQEGLCQILDSRDGMRWSGPVDGTQRALERLWELNYATEIEAPLDRLRIVTIQALACLIPILWRDPWNRETRESNMKDYVAAIGLLKSWGDTGARETTQ